MRMTMKRALPFAGAAGRVLPALALALAVALMLSPGPAIKPAQAQSGIADAGLGGVLVAYSIEGVAVGACNPDGTRPVTSPYAGITAENAAADLSPLELPAGLELADVQAALDVATFESDFIQDGTMVAGDVPSGETHNLEPGTYEVTTSVANVNELAAALNALGLETTVGEQDIRFFEAGQAVTVGDCPDGDGQQPDTPPQTPSGYPEPGSTGDCSVLTQGTSTPESYFTYFPEINGCVTTEGGPYSFPITLFNTTVFDADTGEPLGIFKELSQNLAGTVYLGETVSYESFCGAFPTFGETVVEEVSAQEYYGSGGGYYQPANAQERAILDPNGDGLACTPEDEAFLAGDTDAGDGTGSQFEQTWTGLITQFGEDGTVASEYGIEADIMPISDMTGDRVGEVVGEARYTAGCSGAWVLEEVNEDSVVVEEQIEEGTDICVEIVPVTLSPQEDGTLKYRTGGDYDGVSTGVLTRQGSSAPDGGPEDDDGDAQPPSETVARFGITVLPNTGGPALWLPAAGALLVGSGFVGLAALRRRR